MAKAPAKPEAAEEAPAGKSKKTLFIIIGIVLVLIAGGGGAAWYFMHQSGGPNTKQAEPEKPPVFVTLDNFTVNLSAEDGGDGDKYLQVALTLQVPEEKDAENIKSHMPQVRSRILLLLSSKQASELLTSDGKSKLMKEIVSEINKPFVPKGESQKVSSVFFTSFVIQ
ncbi:flagellar basal body-associated protein FliL [Sulfuriferula sp. AH1]|uniref:flagellar basal body-associated protein FliL n=1 Tax=Sulfuriferula sp. AH1 TaxID=1985873 RepID=UPI000B3B5D69|nr:flagellar basal body-associated protein FliL [Sulfuriferula sp. AH1]ARU31671.1 flagellar basal body-associated protein FliL [Sulfuriferula sp. AH1]